MRHSASECAYLGHNRPPKMSRPYSIDNSDLRMACNMTLRCYSVLTPCTQRVCPPIRDDTHDLGSLHLRSVTFASREPSEANNSGNSNNSNKSNSDGRGRDDSRETNDSSCRGLHTFLYILYTRRKGCKIRRFPLQRRPRLLLVARSSFSLSERLGAATAVG
jgi:hypothetical protein